jgi:hypothetical protein
LAVVKKVKGVEKAEVFQDGVIVAAKDDAEIRPSLAAVIQNNGLSLLELRPLAMTLEEIFLELTHKQLGAVG